MGRREPRADFWGGLERRIHAEWLSVTAVMLALTACLSYFGSVVGVDRVDDALYDRVLATLAVDDLNENIVIIAIDDGSISDLGYWPWRRAVHAQLVSRLGQARAVGFDILFSDRNPAYPDDDVALAGATANHGRVVLPIMIRQNTRGVVPPLPMLAASAAGTGYINIFPDPDGVVRSLRLRQRLADGTASRHLVLSLLDVAGIPPEAHADGVDDPAHRIPFGGPAGTFTTYPYSKVLDGQVPPSAFKDKLVLIGAWASGLGDSFPTPVSDNEEGMPGVEILANGLQAAITGNWIRMPSPTLAALLACVPVLGMCVLFRRLSPRRSFMAMFAILGGVLLGAVLLFRVAGVWVPLTASLIGVVLSMPVWGWRSQEASLQHIDRELKALNRDRAALGADLGARRPGKRDASLPARVNELHNAIDQLRVALDRREETLRFLSHDMRSPQNSILALTQLQQLPQTAMDEADFLARIDAYAHKTLGLVDGFVNLARAQAAKLRSEAVDLVDLIDLCFDDYWALARRRNIELCFDTYPDHAWVKGDAPLLQRTFGNLIDNAIKFSPDGARVECFIESLGDRWQVSVRDQGRGFSPVEAAQLLRPFSRLHEQAKDGVVGVGLGLAFAKTVVERHGGDIRISAREGQGARFDLLIPKAAAF